MTSSSHHEKKTSLDTLLAFKALALMPGLTHSDRRVGAAIVEHFSRATARCDPGVGRLCRLLGLDRSTVFRSLANLDRSQVIVRTRHGGRSLRNSYEPNWTLFRQFEENWNERFREEVKARAVASARPKRSRGCDVPGRTSATQTCSNNLLKEPVCAAPSKRSTAARRRWLFGRWAGRKEKWPAVVACTRGTRTKLI